MAKFIFMLTRGDVTVPNALEVAKGISSSRVEFVGFKDIGLRQGEYRELLRILRDGGKKVFLEVVSSSKDSALRSAEMAKELGVDYLIGGTYFDETMRAIEGSGIKYFPYVGRVYGHPCLLGGSVEEIVEDAKAKEAGGADGVNLLAYRYEGDPVALMRAVIGAVDIPVLVAGSINSLERVREVAELGAWAFTIGGAIFEGRFSPEGGIRAQIEAVLAALGTIGPQ
ncbi:MAG: 4-hydroxythreonine-4-phosphate dehydrogenase [Candidatus Bathyarchaeia archaeon]